MRSSSDTSGDPALLELFRAEMETHLPVLSQGLLALEKGETGDIAAMMRAAHSIKGAARIVGLEAAVRLSHVMEDCFTAAKEKRIDLTSDAVDVLLQCLDALQRSCSPEAGEAIDKAWLEPIMERVAAVRDGRLPAPVPVRPAGPFEAVATIASSPTAAESRVVLPADFSNAAAERIRAGLCRTLAQGVSAIRLDFAHIERVSAGALALLAVLGREADRTEAGPAFVAEGVTGPIAVLLRVTGLDRAFRPGG